MLTKIVCILAVAISITVSMGLRANAAMRGGVRDPRVTVQPSERDKAEVWSAIAAFIEPMLNGKPMPDRYFVVSEIMLTDRGEFVADVAVTNGRYLVVVLHNRVVAATRIMNDKQEPTCKPESTPDKKPDDGLPGGLVHP